MWTKFRNRIITIIVLVSIVYILFYQSSLLFGLLKSLLILIGIALCLFILAAFVAGVHSIYEESKKLKKDIPDNVRPIRKPDNNE